MKLLLIMQCIFSLVCLRTNADIHSSVNVVNTGGDLQDNVSVDQFEGLKKLAQKVMKNDSFDRHVNYAFNRELRHLMEAKLRNKSASQCQAIVRQALSIPLYDSLENL